ncbi:hypothetical protein TNCV_4299541 [Trichonephila clavipes]|nr:hypothetical protein TNCV_4299541 [Trichonephila clavipes]
MENEAQRLLVALRNTAARTHQSFKYLYSQASTPQESIISSTVSQQLRNPYKGVKIHPDETRSYIQYKNYSRIQPLSPEHIFECPTFTPRALKVGLTPLLDPL